MNTGQPPIWANGPAELLRHGIALSQTGKDSDQRIAMILIDNAVELIAKTFFSVPSRVTGLKISRKERNEIEQGFYSLLEGLEKHVPQRLVGIPIEEIEWFHGLRNHLYHQGNGLTVERRHLSVYAEIAELLFEKLFDCKLDIPDQSGNEILGDFFAEWIEVERGLAAATKSDGKYSGQKAAAILLNEGKITSEQYEQFVEIQRIRNQVVHGEADHEEILRSENMKKLSRVGDFVSAVLNSMS